MVPHGVEQILTNDALKNPDIPLEKDFDGTIGNYATIVGKIYAWGRWTGEVEANINEINFQKWNPECDPYSRKKKNGDHYVYYIWMDYTF